MTNKIVFIHGMFQNPKSWDKWINYFESKGFDCVAPAWPLHKGEPSLLRSNPPQGLGELSLRVVIDSILDSIGPDKPIVIGHSVGGLIAQILLNNGMVSSAVAISSVAPNGMIDFDFTSLKNIAVIDNPLKGDDPFLMDAETFHGSFANTLTAQAATLEFERTATHDSRNVLRDCLGIDGKIELDKTHAPLLMIAGEKDEIIPAHLVEKNFDAYEDADGIVEFKSFANRSHYICNEPGWEEVCSYVSEWIDDNLAHDQEVAGLSAA